MCTPESKFDDYIKAKRTNDLHPEVTSLVGDVVNRGGRPLNVVMYGPSGVGKYSCALDYVSRFSPSCLTYEKKAIIETTKGQQVIKMSDIHFEIDLGMLGCNSKQLWNEIIGHIVDIVALRPQRQGIVVCRNFHQVHGELLDSFYSYMQTSHRRLSLVYVLLTESIGFIPKQILNKCVLITVARPKRVMYGRLRKLRKDEDVAKIESIKLWRDDLVYDTKDRMVDAIGEMVTKVEKMDFGEVRERAYDVLFANLNVWSIMWEVVASLSKKGYIREDKVGRILDEVYAILELYNNNYRPVYHLERFIVFLAVVINEL